MNHNLLFLNIYAWFALDEIAVNMNLFLILSYDIIKNISFVSTVTNEFDITISKLLGLSPIVLFTEFKYEL
jgi:hypothetical protein